jgi:hypothetical protein
MFDAGVEAFGFYVAGNCYCNKWLTDGFIKAGALPSLFPGTPRAKTLRYVETLVRVGLWEVVNEGWRVHDFHEYNRTAEQVRALRRARAARVTRWRGRRNAVSNAVTKAPFDTLGNAVSNAVTEGACNAVGNGVGNADRNAAPTPITTTTRTTRGSGTKNTHSQPADAGFDEFWSLYPKPVDRLAAERAWKAAVKRVPPASILVGLRAQLADLKAQDRRYVKHPDKWLNAGAWMNGTVGAEPDPYAGWPHLWDCAGCGEAHETKTCPKAAQ